MKKCLVFLMASLVSAGLFAAPLNLAAVPADAKWAFHVDFESFSASQFGQLVTAEILRQHQPKVDALKQLLGSDLTHDIHSLTVFGPDADEANAVALIQGQFDREKLLSLLVINPAYRESEYEGAALYHWKDEQRGKDQVGTFAAENLIVISQSAERVRTMLDVLAGQKASLAAQSDSALGALLEGTEGVFVAAAATDLSSLTGGHDHAAVLQNSRMMSVIVNEIEGDMCAFVQLEAKHVEAARQVEQVVRGMLAFAALQVQHLPELAPLVQACGVTRTDSSLAFEFRYPSAKLFALMRQHAPKEIK